MTILCKVNHMKLEKKTYKALTTIYTTDLFMYRVYHVCVFKKGTEKKLPHFTGTEKNREC